jgi:DNA invertase Pin-like site-specific DNA recombinase
MSGIIAYFRVSTKRQGASGLGLESQAAAVEAYAEQTGKRIVARYTEVESGRKSNRPELQRAVGHARRSKATLVVAKLDRLARNARFLLTVVESGADVVFCDLPHVPPGPAGKLILTNMAAIAEWEAGVIAQRTREALRAAKARGVALGSARPGHWNGKEDARLAGLAKARSASAEARSERALEAYDDVSSRMLELRRKGTSLRSIASFLNAAGHTTRRGREWNPVQVARVLNRVRDNRIVK